jgi:hypothetical protein
MPQLRHVLPVVATLLLSLPANGAAQRAPVDTLRWLAGCWVTEGSRGSTIEEQWMSPSGGMMLGMSRTVRDGAVREYEFVRIYAAGDTLVYAAMPSRQTPTEFRARSVSRDEVVFENPAHDFPQRVRYRKSGELLIASVEGDRDGRRQPVVFTYRRAACAAAGPDGKLGLSRNFRERFPGRMLGG